MEKIQLRLILVAFFFQQILASVFAQNAVFLGVDIYQMHVKSFIRNRYAQTTVTSKVINIAYKANEAIFSLVLPESGFISGFIMEVDGKNYTAYVKEKDQAEKMFQEAVLSGVGAACVSVSVRDSNRITVTVNVEARKKAAFYLSYEELLARQNGLYELVINLHPGQAVDDLSVEVEINENRKITHLATPPLRSGNQIYINTYELNHGALKKTIKDNRAVVGFSPSIKRQEEFANLLHTKDMERDPEGGQVLVKDGYFAHFFAPSSLPHLPKHVVFVLDTSISMKDDNKLQDLKKAMYEILDQLNPDDIFHLIEFDSNVKLWVLKDSPNYIVYSVENTQKIMLDFHLHNICLANLENIKRAKAAISKFSADGKTDIYSALHISLYLVQLTKLLKKDTIGHEPMLIVLTDGKPNARVNSVDTIVKEITKFNTGLRKTPIFALSFGDGTYRDFLQRLSLSNAGFSKHIYEASDAVLQLKDFYRDVSSPLLANVAFKYESSTNNLTKTQFPLHFKGSELVTAGRYGGHNMEQSVVEAWNGEEDLTFQPSIQQTSSSLERLWAYLTVKQLLEKKDLTDEEQQERKRKAIDLSVRYSFVTPLTSLVVIKPNTINVTNTEIAKVAPTLVEATHPRRNLGAVDDPPSDNSSWPLEQLLDSNQMLNLPSGKYKLEENETISDSVSCSNSILNSDGHCRLLHSCVADGLHMRFDDYILY